MNSQNKAVAIVAALMVIQFPMYYDNSYNPEVEASIVWDDAISDGSRAGSISLNIGKTNAEIDFRLAVFPSLGEVDLSSKIGVYVNSSFSDDECHPLKRKYGLWDHLRAESEFRGFSHRMELIENEEEFGDISKYGIIISLSSLPTEIGVNTREWAESGGLLISVGSWGHQKEMLDYNALLRSEKIEIEDRISLINEEVSEIGSVFSLGTTHYLGGLSSESLEAVEAVDLGFQNEFGTTNVPFIPIGAGGLMKLPCIKNSKLSNDETMMSWDLANLIESGFVNSLIGTNSTMNDISERDIISYSYSTNKQTGVDLEIPILLEERYFSHINIYLFSTLLSQRFTFFESFVSPSGEKVDLSGLREVFSRPIAYFDEGILNAVASGVDKDGFGVIFSSSDNEIVEPESVSVYVSESESHCKETGISYSNELVDKLKIHGISISQFDQFSLPGYLSFNGSGEILIILGTVLPTSVFGGETDLLSPWIEQGGTLFWIGDLIGGSSLENTQDEFEYGNQESLRWDGEKRIFNRTIIGTPFPWTVDSSEKTDISLGLGIEFNNFRTSPDVDSVLQMGGFALGAVSNQENEIRSAVSLVPVGRGNVVLFGGCPSADQSVSSLSSDITAIIESGIIRIGNSEVILIAETAKSERYVSSKMSIDLTEMRIGEYSRAYISGFGLDL